MNNLPTIGAVVRRIEPPTYGLATVAEVDDSGSDVYYLLDYAEGGQGWWPGNRTDWELVTLPPVTPQPSWVEFGAAVQGDAAINQLLGAALATVPALGLGLGVGLGKAADGDARVFLSSWSMARTLGLISPQLLAAVEAMAMQFDLPADFVEALGSAP